MTEQAVESFDPSDHTVAEVQEYLQDAGGDERERVLDLERAGKARKGLLEAPESQVAADGYTYVVRDPYA